MPNDHHESPALTDFIKVSALQQVQDAFVSLIGVTTSIRDANGESITRDKTDNEFCRALIEHPASETVCRECHVQTTRDACRTDGLVRSECHAGLIQYAAPVTINGKPLAAIIVGDRPTTPLTDDQVRKVSDRFGLDYDHLRRTAWGLKNWSDREMQGAIAFAQLLANTLAQMWYQAHELEQRVEELSTVYRVSTLLGEEGDLKEVLNASARLVAEVLKAKAAAIRLLNEETGDLRIVAVHNLSAAYLNKGPVLATESPKDSAAMNGELVYVADMPNDPETIYPDEARTEGIVSALATGLAYRGKTIGVMRVYSGEPRVFTAMEKSLLQAVANQCAAAIIHARMRRDARDAEQLERQVRMGGDVQRRMIPATPPKNDRLEIGCIYEPSHDLGGDFYDFLEFPRGDLGIAIADVVGKGVPASLTMASVRAALRAHAKSIYHLDQIMVEVNRHICRDTLLNEFVTAFYGVFSRDGRSFTFSNAGHEPVILLREARLELLDVGGTVLGIDRDAVYQRGRIELKPNDLLIFLTDGLLEAMNHDGHAYGRERLNESILRHANLDAPQIAKQLLWDVRRFVGLAKQSDDLTLVVVRVRP